MRLALALSLVLAALRASAGAAPDPARAIVDSFIRGLTSNDWPEIAALAHPTDSRYIDEPLAEDLGRYECITIRDYCFEREDANTIRVLIDGDAVTKGAAHR